jgi:putative endonuclease
MYHFYIFRCKDKTLYCGSTNNIKRREQLHNTGRGAIYTRTHGGGRMVYTEDYRTIQEAMKREREVKQWTKHKKENLVRNKS